MDTCKYVITNYEGSNFKAKTGLNIIENSKGGTYLGRGSLGIRSCSSCSCVAGTLEE